MQFSLIAVGLTILISYKATRQMDNPEILKKVLTDYFKGIEEKNHKKMIEATTEDFTIYEMGKVWNNDSVFQNLERNLPFEVKYKFDSLKIKVDSNSGDVTYFNQADFIFSDTIIQHFNWIESATFRKQNGLWKMNFLHISTRR
jgi:hypothetical protein